MRIFRNAWKALVNWLASGDLIPFLVIASVWHYIKALAPHDEWWAAISIGILVDLGHYRTVRIASRYRVSGKTDAALAKSRRQLALRWAIALVMTGISLCYHVYYYGIAHIVLALPFPFLIASLAYFAQMDRHTSGSKEDEKEVAENASERKSVQVDADGDGRLPAKLQAFAILDCNPAIQLRELAAQVGRSESQASRYRKEWWDNGD